jgi:hypothetical protein
MSFPVIHELQGEFSPLYYALKRDLEAARTREALDAFERALESRADALPEQECRKLRLFVARRWKAL